MLVMDEVAFIEHADDIWTGAGLALSATGGKCVMISTPYGTGNLYHKTWVATEKGENTGGIKFHPTKVHWSDHPVFSKDMEVRYDEDGKSYKTSPWYESECERMHQNRRKITMTTYKTSTNDIGFAGYVTLLFIAAKLTGFIDWSWRV